MPFIGGHWYILLILVVIALIIWGPSRLPEIGSGLGRALREFKKATSEATDNLKEEISKPAEPPRAVGTTYPAGGTDPAVKTAPPAETPKA